MTGHLTTTIQGEMSPEALASVRRMVQVVSRSRYRVAHRRRLDAMFELQRLFLEADRA